MTALFLKEPFAAAFGKKHPQRTFSANCLRGLYETERPVYRRTVGGTLQRTFSEAPAIDPKERQKTNTLACPVFSMAQDYKANTVEA